MIRVRDTLKLSMLYATLIVTTGFIVVQIFAPYIISFFTKNDPILINEGAKGLRIFLALLPIVGFQISGSSYFQFIGKPKNTMFLGLSRQVLLLIPAVIILPMFFGLTGVWMAGPVADGLSSVLTGAFVLRELEKLKKLNLNPAAAA